MRRRIITLIAVATVVASTGSACASSGGGPAPADGVWRSEGYGMILEIAGGRVREFQTTSVSCLPGPEQTQVGAPGPDGTVAFGDDDGETARTVRVTGPGRAELHPDGTVGAIDLVAVPAVPQPCTAPAPTDPLSTFDVFLATFAEHYNATAIKKIDWAAVRDRYRPLVRADTGPDELFAIMEDVVRPLGDNHVEIEGPDDASFTGVRPGTRTDAPDGAHDAIDAHLRDDLGAGDVRTWARGQIAFADLPDGRGYLRVSSFEGWRTRPDDYQGRRALLDEVLDEVLTADRAASWRSLVIDIRDNGGGDDRLGTDLAGRLTDTPYTAYTKRARTSPTDPTVYGPERVVTVEPTPGRPHYTGPIRLLTSDLSVSAAETFTEALMGRTPAPARVGTATQGVFADTLDRTLPNGWTVTLGNENYTAPDGRDYEGVGVPPTVPVPTLTDDQLAARRDPALDLPDDAVGLRGR